MRPGVTEADFAGMDAGVIHPLTGPVAVKGAEPGDLLEVEFVDIQPQPYAFSVIFPGFGFLRDVFADPFMVHWSIADGYATSEQIPGVRVPGASFMGVSGVAPSHAQLEAWTQREAELAERGGVALPPDAAGAVPISGVGATHGIRTLPPRENGGNFDVKQLSPAPSCCCRWPWLARCSPPATATSPRATARSASPPWKWAPPAPSGSAC